MSKHSTTLRWSRFNRLFRSERLGRFLYNALSNKLLEVDEEHYVLLEALQNGCHAAGAADTAFIGLLRTLRVLAGSEEEEGALLARQYRRYASAFDSSRLDLTLCPTLACNFRCPYCFEQTQRTGITMDQTTMERLIAFIRSFTETRHLSIAWYGGEPLLAFDAMVTITERIKALDLDFRGAGLVTNGYLLDAGKIARLADLGIGSIQITLDGPRQVHDRRRLLADGGPTFDRILDNVAALLDSPARVRCHIRVNVDRTNVGHFLALRASLLERFKGKNLRVYPGQVDTGTEHACDLACDLDTGEWTDFLLGMYRAEGWMPSGGFHPNAMGDHGCTATRHLAFVVGPEGEIYKCWKDVGQVERVVGSLTADEPVTGHELRARYSLGTDPYNHPDCRACAVLPICGGGCAHSRLRARQFGEEEVEFCSPYRDRLIPYLEAYIDAFRSREICTSLLRDGPWKETGRGYHIISPEKRPDGEPNRSG